MINEEIARNVVNEKEAAKILGISVHTLRSWRYKKNSLIKHIKFNRAVRYDINDLYELIRKRAINS